MTLTKWSQLFKNRTLFYKFLSSFFIIILLFVSFIGMSYSFFITMIREEVTKNSSLNLNMTVQNYEKHFELIRNMGLTHQFSNETRFLLQEKLDMNISNNIRNMLKDTLSNPLLYLNNILIYLKKYQFVIEMNSTSDASLMMNRLLYSPQYPLDFWNNQLKQPVSFKLYPSVEYFENSMGTPESKGSFMPILMKNINETDFAVIALLDSQRTFQDFHQSGIGTGFAILDAEGLVTFQSSTDFKLPAELNKARINSGYLLTDDQYYFYQTGNKTGFTYVSMIPYSHLNNQITKLNIVFGLLLLLSVVISLGTSIFFSRKLNAPIRGLINRFQSMNYSPFQSNIQEFNVISDSIDRIHQELEQKNSLLMLYAYTNQVKRIHMNPEDFKPLPKPYIIILFQLTFKQRFFSTFQGETERASYFFREYISSYFSEQFESTVVVQLEKDQIMAVLYFEDGQQPDVLGAIGEILEVFNRDKEFCLLTIAVSSPHQEVANFSEAYTQVVAMVHQRKLGEEPQWVKELREKPHPFVFESYEDRDFMVNLMEGNEEHAIPLVQRALERLHRKEAFASQFHDFAKEIVNRIVKNIYSQNIDFVRLMDEMSPYEHIRECYTYESYSIFLEQLLQRTCKLIKEKKSETDHITGSVIQYIEDHYQEDISLDLLADHLSLSRGYLSTYFKEKTGTNFVDYVISYRINKAKEILLNTDLKVQEVSQLVGYSNVSTFIRVFKKLTGLTPGDFKKPRTF